MENSNEKFIGYNKKGEEVWSPNLFGKLTEEIKKEPQGIDDTINDIINWIPIDEITKFNPEESILIWQKNLNDDESSRFQRAIYLIDFIDVYPLTNKTTFKLQDGEFKGRDLEGDNCIVTHFAFVNNPNK